MLDGKYECAGSSRIGALEESAIEDMIEIARSIAHDYEHGLRGQWMRRSVKSACTGCIAVISRIMKNQ